MFDQFFNVLFLSIAYEADIFCQYWRIYWYHLWYCVGEFPLFEFSPLGYKFSFWWLMIFNCWTILGASLWVVLEWSTFRINYCWWLYLTVSKSENFLPVMWGSSPSFTIDSWILCYFYLGSMLQWLSICISMCFNFQVPCILGFFFVDCYCIKVWYAYWYYHER